MSKHTPGPWLFVAGNQIRSAAHQIARIWMMRNGEGLANARLIAAAPELLEALSGVVNLWDHHASAHGDGVISPLHAAARAAITKATNPS